MKHSFLARAFRTLVVASLAQFAWLPAAQARTEIAFWHAMEGPIGEALGELVDGFNKSQEEFEVKAVFKGTYPEVLAATILAYRQNAAPHIVQVYELGTQRALLMEGITPVYRLMRQNRIDLDWTDFIGTISGYYSNNDRLSSMPFNVSTPILFYNKDIFRRAGLEDTPPATWQEVEAASRKILASGAAPCGFTVGWPSWTILESTFAWHDQPFATNRNGYAGLDTKLLFNNEFGRMHVDALVRWQAEGLFVYGGRTDAPNARFVNGECAMLVQSSAFIGQHAQSSSFDWGTGQMPHWGSPYPKASTLLGGASLWVVRGRASADYRGVALFLKHLSDPTRQAWWAAATGYMPIRRSAVDILEGAGFYGQNPRHRTALSQLLNAPATASSQGIRLGDYVQVRQAIESELENVFSGKKTVKEGLDASVLRGNAILRSYAVMNGGAPQGEL